jgi:hypothetical protein
MIFSVCTLKKPASPKFLMCAVRRYENTEETLKNGCRMMLVKWISSACQTGIVSTAEKQKQKKRVEDKSEIHIVTWRSLNSSQKISDHTKLLLKINVSCVKRIK